MTFSVQKWDNYGVPRRRFAIWVDVDRRADLGRRYDILEDHKIQLLYNLQSLTLLDNTLSAYAVRNLMSVLLFNFRSKSVLSKYHQRIINSN